MSKLNSMWESVVMHWVRNAGHVHDLAHAILLHYEVVSCGAGDELGVEVERPIKVDVLGHDVLPV